MSFLNAALVLGLVVVVIPPLVHFFTRRRTDEVEWAAMQFLQLSPATRRRVTWDHLLVLLLRMGLLAALVLALASPTMSGRFGSSAERDIVLVIDGSASMAYRNPHSAHEWAATFIAELGANDRVAVIQARRQPVPIVPSLTPDHEQARDALEQLAPPSGSADWPQSLQAAFELLENARPNRHVVVLTDGQRHGWADETTRAKWQLLRQTGAVTAPVWVVNGAPDRPADPPNWSLDPLTTGRAVAPAGREVTFRSALRFSGGEPRAPGKLRFEVNGRPIREVKPDGAGREFIVRFTHKFPPGSHVVSLLLDADELPDDNRQHFAIESLAAIPVLIVEDVAQNSDYLRDALAPPGDSTPAFAVKVISLSEFGVASVATVRVLILANLAMPTAEQVRHIERFLADGGSVLVTLGDRADAPTWNRLTFRGGQGFLPARLVDVVDDGAPTPDPASFTHPAMTTFRDPLPGGLHTAQFPRRWKLDLTAGVNGVTGTPVVRLTTGEALLAERGYGNGRVIVAAVPLDASWGTNLPRMPDYVRLVHELAYQLAGARGADLNLDAEQSIVFTPRPDESPGPVTLTGPDGLSRAVAVTAWPLVLHGPHDPGPYRLTTPSGRTHYLTVRSDPREMVLTPCTEDDRRTVADAIGTLAYITNPDEIADPEHQTRELWWLLLVLVLVLLGLEVWFTRRLVPGAGR